MFRRPYLLLAAILVGVLVIGLLAVGAFPPSVSPTPSLTRSCASQIRVTPMTNSTWRFVNWLT